MDVRAPGAGFPVAGVLSRARASSARVGCQGAGMPRRSGSSLMLRRSRVIADAPSAMAWWILV